MLKVGFYLANKRDLSSIDAIIRFSGQRYKYPAGISVNSKYWNTKSQRVRELHNYQDAFIINGRLDSVAVAVQAVANRFISTAKIPTPQEFVLSVDRELNPAVSTSTNEYLTDFIKNYYPTLTRAHNTVKRYVTTLNALTEFEKDRKKKIRFQDVNMNLYNELRRWFGLKDFSLNYFGDYIKNIKVFFKAAGASGLHSLTLPDSFSVISADTDAIYLNIDELQMLHNLVINEDLILDNYDATILNVTGNIERAIKSLTDCRDRFLIGAFTAMRFSDYAFLKGLKYQDDYITRISEKTGTKTVIPMHPIIRNVLKRRNDVLPPAISNQKMNDQLKVLGRMAGIKDKVEITIAKVNGKERKSYLKYELLTTHTARRSGCTIMFLAGIDTISIMSFSGHKTVKSFMKYIRASQVEVAMRMKDHPFFK